MEFAELTWTYHYMDYLGGAHQYTRLQIQVGGVGRTTWGGTHQYTRLQIQVGGVGRTTWGGTHQYTRLQIQVGSEGRRDKEDYINMLDCRYRYRKGWED